MNFRKFFQTKIGIQLELGIESYTTQKLTMLK